MAKITAHLDIPEVDYKPSYITIDAHGYYQYAPSSYGWNVNGYLAVGSKKNPVSGVSSSTPGGKFGDRRLAGIKFDRRHEDYTVSITMYGYCVSSTSDKSTAVRTVVCPALDSYEVFADGVKYTKWWDEELILPTPQKEGYIFGGWTDGTTNYGTAYTVNAGATLTSVWYDNSPLPKILEYNCQRVVGDEGTVKFRATMKLGENDTGARIEVQYRERGSEDDWAVARARTVFPPIDTAEWTVEGIFDPHKDYDIRWLYYGSGWYLYSYDILTSIDYIFKAKNGKLDFGVPVSRKGYEIFDRSMIQDWIVSMENQDGWEVRTWNSGFTELYKRVEVSLPAYSANNGLYRATATVSLPFAIESSERLEVSGSATQSGCWAIVNADYDSPGNYNKVEVVSYRMTPLSSTSKINMSISVKAYT